jgi:hypothetical protein
MKREITKMDFRLSVFHTTSYEMMGVALRAVRHCLIDRIQIVCIN